MKWQIGQRVYREGRYCASGVVVSAVDEAPANVYTLSTGKRNTEGGRYEVIFDDGSFYGPASAFHFDGYRTLDGQGDVAEYRQRKAAKIEADKVQAEKAAIALQAEKDRLLAENPSFVRGADQVTAAKNIRKILKAEWPHCKFSVRTETYSGGCSINVRWQDGPTEEQVDAKIARFKAGHFNGMEDIYEYSKDPWGDLFGSANYLHTDREVSDDLVTCAIVSIADAYNVADADLPSIEDWRQGRCYQTGPCGDAWQNGTGDYWAWSGMIGRKLRELAA